MNQKFFLLFLLLSVSFFSQSQVCTGSLGDPVVNVTFGSGANPGKALPGSINNNYTYTTQPCPQDGFYTIVNSTSNCNSNTWQTVAVDHTANDVDGYMMLVNATINSGDFYVDTVKDLCPNTTYEFAAWIMNVLRPTACNGSGKQPNLSFKIETGSGTVLGSYNTGDISPTLSGEWKQYGLFFATPAGVSNIVLRLTNNASGGCGNDLILDDITFRPCGPTVNATINLNAGVTTVNVCQDDASPYTMNASLSAGYINPAFQWQFSTDSVIFTDIKGATATSYVRGATAPGNYYYRLSASEAGNFSSLACRIASNVLVIRVNENPVVKASVSGPVCEDESMSLSAGGGSMYNWTGPGGFSSSMQNPKLTASLNMSGKYIVNVITDKGCKSNDSLMVQVFPKAVVNAGEDQTICEGSNIMLNPSDAASYLWSPAVALTSVTARNPYASPNDTTLYTLTVKDNNGCMKSDTIRINVLKKAFADAGSEVRIFEGQSANLNGIVRGTNITFFWTPLTSIINSNMLNPTVSPKENIYYVLHVISNVGCGAALDNVFVRVYKKVEVPTAFSPNGDGVNDEWAIDALTTYTESEMTVFNRYGSMVFRSRGYGKRWDGRYKGEVLPWGTYYYTIDLKNGMPLISGWVLLVK